MSFLVKIQKTQLRNALTMLVDCAVHKSPIDREACVYVCVGGEG